MSWPAKAEALGQLIGKSELHKQAVRYLEENRGPVGIACSGGLDSVSALLLVYWHFQNLRSCLHVLHFNHNIRGAESDEDEAFTRDLALSLGLPFFQAAWTANDSGDRVSEAQARAARHAFYDSFLDKHPGAMLVTGHQQDDILENLLLKLARSSNLTGLSAPRPVQLFDSGKVLIRPLLSLRKARLEKALRHCGIPWRLDRTNLENHFDRNRLRNTIIPAWKSATQFDLFRAADRVRMYLEEAEEALDYLLKLARFPDVGTNPVSLPSAEFPRGAVRKWLHLWLAAQGLHKSPKPSAVDEILDAIQYRKDDQWSAGDGFVRLEGGRISFQLPTDADAEPFANLSLSPGKQVELPRNRTLKAEVVHPTPALLKDLKNGKYSEDFTVLIDSELLPEKTFAVRPWRPGDRYRALNAPGHRKLQDMFVDRKITKTERKVLPVVLSSDSHILWCPGLPVAHSYRVTQKTKEILQLTYTC